MRILLWIAKGGDELAIGIAGDFQVQRERVGQGRDVCAPGVLSCRRECKWHGVALCRASRIAWIVRRGAPHPVSLQLLAMQMAAEQSAFIGKDDANVAGRAIGGG